MVLLKSPDRNVIGECIELERVVYVWDFEFFDSLTKMDLNYFIKMHNWAIFFKPSLPSFFAYSELESNEPKIIPDDWNRFYSYCYSRILNIGTYNCCMLSLLSDSENSDRISFIKIKNVCVNTFINELLSKFL